MYRKCRCKRLLPYQALLRCALQPLTRLSVCQTPPEEIPSRSFFERNHNVLKELRKTFAELYPGEFKLLEGIRKEEAHNTAWSQLKKTYWKQRKRKATNTGDSIN